MPIAPQLQHFVDDELARAPALIERAVGDIVVLLRDTQDGGPTAVEHGLPSELIDRLRRHAAIFASSFVESLQTRVEAELDREDGGSGMAPPSGLGGLSLMDESRVEIDIEISRATQLIDTAAEWELRELQAFTSTLSGLAHVSRESNPMRPMLYATALWDAACVVHPAQPQRALLLRMAATACAALLKRAWAAASTRLESQGVTPGVYRTVVLTTGSGTTGSTPRPAAAELWGTLLSAMPGERDLQISPGGPAGTSAPRTAQIATVEFEQALARLDEILRQLPGRAVSKADAAELATRLAPHRCALAASAGTVREQQTVALISHVFDAMLTDPELHPAFVPVVARLQVSALRVAVHDTASTQSTPHPVWQLIDRIGEASTSFPKPSDPRGVGLHGLCQRLTEGLSRSAIVDAGLCQKALAKLDEFLAAQTHAQLRAAERSVQALREAEKVELLERSLTQRLVEQMEPLRPSPVVRRFLSGSWSRVLAASILQFGDEAPASKGYIKLVDDLLWSVNSPDHPASRQRLANMLPGLLQRLRAGMALITLPQPEQQVILDELKTIHTAALRSDDAPDQLVQHMRDEVVSPEDLPSTEDDQVIDLESLQTVPAELMPLESATPDGNSSVKQVATLLPPERRRMFVNGRWACVQLLWRSDHGLFFLFAGETAGRTHSITRSALERLQSAGLIRPLEGTPLSQRALDAVARQVSRAGGMAG